MAPPARLVLLLPLALAGCTLVGGEHLPVTPHRPTFSRSTATTAEGSLEVETGLVVDPDDLFDTPTTFKSGLSDRSEVFVDVSPFVDVETDGVDGDGFGDLAVGVCHRFWEERDDEPSAAFQLLTKLPTGDEDEGLSSGEIDFFAAAIATKTLGPDSVTAFYQLGVLGDPDGAGTDLQNGLAVSGSHPLDERLGVYGELAALFGGSDVDDLTFATVGFTHPAAPDLVFDAGVRLGLLGDAPDLQLLFGLTYNLGRIVRAAPR